MSVPFNGEQHESFLFLYSLFLPQNLHAEPEKRTRGFMERAPVVEYFRYWGPPNWRIGVEVRNSGRQPLIHFLF